MQNRKQSKWDPRSSSSQILHVRQLHRSGNAAKACSGMNFCAPQTKRSVEILQKFENMAPDCRSAAFFALVLLFLNAVLVQGQEPPTALPAPWLWSPSPDLLGAPSIFPAEAPPPVLAPTVQPLAQDFSFPPSGSPFSPPISSPLLAPSPAPAPSPYFPASTPFSDIQLPPSLFLSDSSPPPFFYSSPSSMATFPPPLPEFSTESVTDPSETDYATSINGKIVLNAGQKLAIAFTVLIGLVILSGLCYLHKAGRDNLKRTKL